MRYAVFALLLQSCMLTSASRPMRVLDYADQGAHRARGLIVFLHGLGDNAGSFERWGLVRRASEHGWDSIAVGSHFGYYRGFTLVEALEQDVFAPARAMGYRNIWVVGVSMGGFGALSYAQAHPRDIDGVMLFAPYLGEAEIIAEIRDAGNLGEWEAGDIAAMEDSRPRQTRKVWVWIREQLQARNQTGTPIYLAYGTEDPGAPDHGLLGRFLPEDRVIARPGVHKWTTWSPLSEQLFDAAWTE